MLINAFLSFPGILLAIAFAAFFGPGLDKVILALIITGWAGYARLARAQVLKVKELDYILAARSLGPQQRSHSFAPRSAERNSARADSSHNRNGERDPRRIHAEFSRTRRSRARSELGSDAQRRQRLSLQRSAHGNFSSVAIMLAVLAFNLLGDALRDWLDPRTRSYLVTLDLSR